MGKGYKAVNSNPTTLGQSQPLIQDNVFVLPDKPGLGVELNEEVAREHLMPGYDYFGE